MHIARNGSALVSIVLGVVACSPTSTGSGNVSAYTLTLKVQGGGRIQVTGVPDCQTNCTAYLAAGSKITLTAAPDAGSGFTSWSGDCSGKDACTLTVDANRTVTATFSALPPPPTGKHWLTIALKGSGSVTSSPAGIDCGTRCLASYDEGNGRDADRVAAVGLPLHRVRRSLQWEQLHGDHERRRLGGRFI